MTYDGSIKIDTKLDNGGIERGLEKLKSSVKIGAAAVGAALAAGIGLATKAGMDFESQMSKVSAISGATDKEMTALSDKAKQLGIDTAFSATQAGEAFNYMAMAGWKTEDMLAGISGVMDLAAASGEDLGLVSDIVTNALTAFGLQASDAAHFSDVLATASSNSNTNVAMMGATFKYVAPIAGALGFSVEDCAVAIGLMANAGIKGEQAGTTLRATLTRLAKPPKEAADAIAALGLEITTADGNMRTFNDIVVDLRDKFDGLTDAEKAQYAAMLGGQEAMSGLLAIVNASEDDFNKLTEAIGNADGSAKQMADTMLDNLKGQLTLMGSSLEGLGLAIYDGLQEPLKEAVKVGIKCINDLSNSFKSGELKGAINSVGKLIGELVKVIANVATAVIPVLTKALSFLANNLKTITSVVLAAVAAIKTFQIITAVTAVIKGMVAAWQTATLQIALYSTANGAAAVSQAALNGTLTIGETLVALLTHKITLATAAQALLNTVMSANPIGAVMAAVAALVVGLGILCVATGKQTAAEREAAEAERKLAEERRSAADEAAEIADERLKTWDELKKAQQDKAATDMVEVDSLRGLYSELQKHVDENGKIIGSKERVLDISKKINEIAPNTVSVLGDEIKGYQGVKQAIEDAIEAKKAKILLDAMEPVYAEAQKNLIKNEQDLSEAIKQTNLQRDVVAQKENLLKDLKEKRDSMYGKVLSAGETRELNSLTRQIDELTKSHETEKATLESRLETENQLRSAQADNYKQAAVYEQAEAAIKEQNYSRAVELMNEYNANLRTAQDDTYENLVSQEENAKATHDRILAQIADGTIPEQMAEQAAATAEKILQRSNDELIESAIQNKQNLADVGKLVGDDYMLQYLEALKASHPELVETIDTLLRESGYETRPTAKQVGADAKDSFVSGTKKTINPDFSTPINEAGIVAEKAAYKVGQNIAEGVEEGIRASTFKIAAAGTDAALAGIEAAKEAADIHSPSRVMRDEVGAMLDKGAVVGIVENLDEVEEAGANLANAAIDAAKTAANSNAMRDEVGAQLDAGLAEGIAENEKEVTDAFQHVLDVLEYKRKFDIISEDEYYTELGKLRDQYFAVGTKEWYQYTEKIYSYEKKLAESQKKEITDLYQSIADTATKRIDEISKAQEKLEKKMQSYGKLTDEVTIKNYGSGGEELKFTQLHDIQSDITALRDYKDALQTVKDRMTGFDDSTVKDFFAVMADMSIEDGADFAQLLASSTDSDFTKYISDWAEKQRIAKELSAALYQDEADAAKQAADETKQYIIDGLTEAGLEIPDGFLDSGKAAAENFATSFMAELSGQMQKIKDMVSSISISITPNAAFAVVPAGASSGGSTVINEGSRTYQFASAGETVAQQLQTIRAADERDRLRGR